MRAYAKKNFPLTRIRRFLEPGPILLVSSAYQGEWNIMTLGWHMVLGFDPALVGCYIWDENHSFSLIRRSKTCVINIPGSDLIDAVIGVGNTHGGKVDKFQAFILRRSPHRRSTRRSSPSATPASSAAWSTRA